MTHTKGPWTAVARTNAYIEIEAPGQIGYMAKKVAMLSMPNHEANARLIAAAPDLLEALKIASDWMIKIGPNAETGTSDWNQHCQDLVRIGDAIAKATGATK